MAERRGRWRECQSPTHVEGCPCVPCKKTSCDGCRLTDRDHVTAKAIARELGWSKKEIESPENKQYLSAGYCHREKDRKTTAVIKELRKQKSGKKIRLGEHVRIGLLLTE